MRMEQSRKQINIRLDKALKLLSEVIVAINKEDSDISSALRRKLVAKWKAVDSRRAKLHHYRSLAEFDKSVG